MATRDIDWQYLRDGLAWPGLLLLAGLLLWGGSTAWRAAVTAGVEAQRQALAGLEQERSDLVNRRAARRASASAYRELQARGVVGGDQRLAWLQDLRDSSASLGLPYLRYTASPEARLQAAWLGDSAAVSVNAMELQLGLVHEGDLLRLFARLRESPGIFQVGGCRLERLAGDRPPEPDKANLTGICQVAWYALPRAGGAGGMLAASDGA